MFSDTLPLTRTHPIFTMLKRTTLNYHRLTLYLISKWSHYVPASEQLQIHRAHLRPQTYRNRRRGALVSPLSSFCLSSAFCCLQNRHTFFLFRLSEKRKEVSRASMCNKILLFFFLYRAKTSIMTFSLDCTNHSFGYHMCKDYCTSSTRRTRRLSTRSHRVKSGPPWKLFCLLVQFGN